jgi:hypothetical protein
LKRWRMWAAGEGSMQMYCRSGADIAQSAANV